MSIAETLAALRMPNSKKKNSYSMLTLIDTFVIDDKMMKYFQSSIFMVNKSISFDGEQ